MFYSRENKGTEFKYQLTLWDSSDFYCAPREVSPILDRNVKFVQAQSGHDAAVTQSRSAKDKHKPTYI